MPDTGKIEELTKSLKVYVQTNIELFKLSATERISVFGSSIMSLLIVGFSLFLLVLFFSITVGFCISRYFNDYALGFLIVTGFYFLLTLILIICRRKCIEKPMRDKIIRRMLKK